MNKLIGRLYICIYTWIVREVSKIKYTPYDEKDYVRTWFLIPTVHFRKIHYPMRYTQEPYYVFNFYFLCYSWSIAFCYIHNLRDLVLMRRWSGKKECTKKVEV